MQVTISKPGLISFAAEDKSNYYLALDELIDISELSEFVCAPIQSEVKNVINRPGEYEYGSLNVVALESRKERIGLANIFKVEIDGVNALVVLGPTDNLNSEDFTLIGKVDMVICGENFANVGFDKLLKKLDIQTIILVGSIDTEKVSKILGIAINDTVNKLKFDARDFKEDYNKIDLFILT